MKKLTHIITLIIIALYSSYSVAQEPPTSLQSNVTEDAKFTGLVTFAFYKDIEAGDKFYSEIMGLTKTYQRSATRIFRISPTSAIGLMDLNAVEGAEVMNKDMGFSFLIEKTEDVDRWYEYLISKGVEVYAKPSNGTRTPVRSVHFYDSDGYDIEIFGWLPGAEMFEKF